MTDDKDYEIKVNREGKPVVVEVAEALPDTLKGVLGDLDVTAELKRRLELKKQMPLSVEDECNCKQLSDGELLQAAQTAHDIRTGKVRVEDVAPPVEIHPQLIEAATCSPSRGEAPSGDEFFRRLERERYNRSLDELEKDIKISKKIFEELSEHNQVKAAQKVAVQQLLDEAVARQSDKEIAFVPVSGLDPRRAAQRVIRLKDEYDQVEPVDLTGVLDDVNPICDVHIDRLQNIMNVRKAVDIKQGVPDEIKFVIPSSDLPERVGLMADGTYVPPVEPDDVVFAISRYVHLDSMPKELQRVIRAYQALKSGSPAIMGSNPIDPGRARRFREAIAELARRTEATFTDDDPKAA